MGGFQKLDALFETNPNGYARVTAGDPYGVARRHAELTLERIDATNVLGVEKLSTDGAATTRKFLDTLAELSVAQRFAGLGARCWVLADDAFKPARYTPDLLVEMPSGMRLLVDVVRASSGSPQLAEALLAELSVRGLQVQTEQFAGLELSAPSIRAHDRDGGQDLCRAVASTVADHIQKAIAAGATDGTIRIYRTAAGLRADAGTLDSLYDDVVAPDREPWLGSVAFRVPGPNGRTIGGGATVGRILADDSHGHEFLRKVQSKAQKQRSLPLAHASTPFVVAVQNEETDLQPVTVLSTLTGGRCWLGTPMAQVPLPPPRIAAALAEGWGPLLREWDYVDAPQVRFSEYGAFVEAWARTVGAVLVTHHGEATTQWLPNPFADPSIRDLRLLQVGLPLDKLGA